QFEDSSFCAALWVDFPHWFNCGNPFSDNLKAENERALSPVPPSQERLLRVRQFQQNLSESKDQRQGTRRAPAAGAERSRQAARDEPEPRPRLPATQRSDGCRTHLATRAW